MCLTLILTLPNFRMLDFAVLFMFFKHVFVCAYFPEIAFCLLKITVVSWMLVKPDPAGVKGMEDVN